jgi:hypothetical protein
VILRLRKGLPLCPTTESVLGQDLQNLENLQRLEKHLLPFCLKSGAYPTLYLKWACGRHGNTFRHFPRQSHPPLPNHHLSPKNHSDINDSVKPIHPLGAHRDAATVRTPKPPALQKKMILLSMILSNLPSAPSAAAIVPALGTRSALRRLFHSFRRPSFCQKIPFPPFLFEHFSDIRI